MSTRVYDNMRSTNTNTNRNRNRNSKRTKHTTAETIAREYGIDIVMVRNYLNDLDIKPDDFKLDGFEQYERWQLTKSGNTLSQQYYGFSNTENSNNEGSNTEGSNLEGGGKSKKRQSSKKMKKVKKKKQTKKNKTKKNRKTLGKKSKK